MRIQTELEHTCQHVQTAPVPCPGCNLPNSPYRPAECVLCGGAAEINQCVVCAIWVDEIDEAAA